jgi:hypothetical protein
MPTQSSKREPGINFSFKLFYEDGTASVFYKNRDIKKDFQTIFNLIRYDSLFNPHTCKLELSLNENRCTIYIEGLGLPFNKQQEKETTKYLYFAIENKLLQANLYNHFYICGNSFISSPRTLTTPYISYDAKNLIQIIPSSANALEIEKMEFPEESIPEIFLCSLTYGLMDIPYYDYRDRRTLFEKSALFSHMRRSKSTNPFTKQFIKEGGEGPLHGLWGAINNFMKKVRVIYSRDLSYDHFMSAIVDEKKSSLELEDILNKRKSKNTQTSAQSLLKQAVDYYKNHEYASAAYLFQQMINNYNESDKTSLPDLKTIRLYNAIALLKNNDYETAAPLCHKLIEADRNPKDNAWAIMLINLINYHLMNKESKASPNETIIDAKQVNTMINGLNDFRKIAANTDLSEEEASSCDSLLESLASFQAQLANKRSSSKKGKEKIHQINSTAWRKQYWSVAKNAFKQLDDTHNFLHNKLEEKLFKQLEILIPLNCLNTPSGRAKALRNAAAKGLASLIKPCSEILHVPPDVADNTPHKGFTPMHWAVKNNRLECAWLLHAIGLSSFDKPSAVWKENGATCGGETARQLIRKNGSKEMKSLLHSYYRFIIKPVNNTDNDAAQTANVKKSLPQLKKILGLSDDTHLIYLPTLRHIIVSPGIIPETMNHRYINYASQRVLRSPDIAKLYTIKSFSQLVEQKNVVAEKKMRFTILVDFCVPAAAWSQYRQLNLQNTSSSSSTLFATPPNNITLPHQDSITLPQNNIALYGGHIEQVISPIVALLREGGLVKKQADITVNPPTFSFSFFTFDISCNISGDLQKFLLYCIAIKLKTLQGGVYRCTSIAPIQNFVNQQSVVNQQNTSPTI